jgi:RNA polymerase sigma-70 factor (sigma-E family)
MGSVTTDAGLYTGREGRLEMSRDRELERERDRILTSLFIDHYDPLRRLAYVVMGDGPIAEEIVMEAFAKAMAKWHLVSKADHPAAYMRQIVVNLCRSKIRRNILERKVGEMFKRREEDIIDRTAEDYGMDIDIWKAVQALPERQRIVVVLRYLEDLSEPEIAEVIDLPVGTVKSQLSRARRKLADKLGSSIVGEVS